MVYTYIYFVQYDDEYNFFYCKRQFKYNLFKQKNDGINTLV